MATERRYNDDGIELYQWSDGEWYTMKKIRAMSRKKDADLLAVRTLSRQGTEMIGRPAINTHGGCPKWDGDE